MRSAVALGLAMLAAILLLGTRALLQREYIASTRFEMPEAPGTAPESGAFEDRLSVASSASVLARAAAGTKCLPDRTGANSGAATPAMMDERTTARLLFGGPIGELSFRAKSRLCAEAGAAAMVEAMMQADRETSRAVPIDQTGIANTDEQTEEPVAPDQAAPVGEPCEAVPWTDSIAYSEQVLLGTLEAERARIGAEIQQLAKTPPDSDSDAQIVSLRQERARIAERRERLLQTFRPEYPEIMRLEERMAQVDRAVAARVAELRGEREDRIAGLQRRREILAMEISAREGVDQSPQGAACEEPEERAGIESGETRDIQPAQKGWQILSTTLVRGPMAWPPITHYLLATLAFLPLFMGVMLGWNRYRRRRRSGR